MTINEIIQQNEELQIQYSKALNTITILERKLEKLQKENQRLAEENKKLRKLNNILYRAMEIALQIHNAEAQYRHLSLVLQKIRETGEFTKG
jgi:FtsZ-binding cell division protein ZapB